MQVSAPALPLPAIFKLTVAFPEHRELESCLLGPASAYSVLFSGLRRGGRWWPVMCPAGESLEKLLKGTSRS